MRFVARTGRADTTLPSPRSPWPGLLRGGVAREPGSEQLHVGLVLFVSDGIAGQLLGEAEENVTAFAEFSE